MKDDELGAISMVVMMAVVVITLAFLLYLACFSKVEKVVETTQVVVKNV